MGKTLMLVFLSDVKIGNDGKVSETEYKDVGAVHTTNESAVRYLVKEKGPLDHLFMFVSNKVKGHITYKDTNGEIKEYGDASGTPISHVAYFKKRISDIITGDSTKFTEIEFNENNTPEESMDCILEMAESIQAYIKPFSEDTQIVLHADCTGGLRHANMLMMAVLRIMQYNGVKIGKLLYSNYQRKVVEEADSIYELFDFVSGAEEFANFGSANAISHYFQKKEQPKVLADLLKSMNIFSEEIRLCHRRGLMKASKNLKKSIEDFEKADEANLNIRLVRQLKARIKRDYSSLLEEDFSILNLIKWCLEHDYLQQALTLYVEGVPDYLYDKKFFQLSDDNEKKYIIQEQWKKNSEYTKGFFQMVVFRPQNTNDMLNKKNGQADKMTSKIVKLMKSYIPIKKNKDIPIDLSGMLSAVKEELNKIPYICLSNPARMQYLFKKLETWRKDTEQLMNYYDKDNFFYEYLKSENLIDHNQTAANNMKKLCNHLLTMHTRDYEKYITRCRVEYAYEFMSYCESEQNYFNLYIPKENMRQILNDYGYFKNERNASNHARLDDDVITADELKEKMAKAVDFIMESEALCEFPKE